MKLHVTTASEGPGVPVVITHGLYGQGRNLGVVARQLEGRQVLLVDLRNHGESPWSDVHDYPAMADDLVEVIEAAGGKADLVAHSMGGKAAMVAALLHPDRINRLVVMDMAPVAYDHDQMIYVDAMRDLDLSGLRSRSEADQRLAARLGSTMLRGFFLQSLDLKRNPPSWKLNLDVLARNMDLITGWPDGLPAGSFSGPTLFIHGANSDYVTTEAAQSAIKHHFPQAQMQAIADSGHWLHAERPQETARAIAEFLSA